MGRSPQLSTPTRPRPPASRSRTATRPCRAAAGSSRSRSARRAPSRRATRRGSSASTRTRRRSARASARRSSRSTPPTTNTRARCGCCAHTTAAAMRSARASVRSSECGGGSSRMCAHSSPRPATGAEEDKVRKGDRVRFTLDFDEGDGVMRLAINGRDRGVVFKGARAAEWWPAFTRFLCYARDPLRQDSGASLYTRPWRSIRTPALFRCSPSRGQLPSGETLDIRLHHTYHFTPSALDLRAAATQRSRLGAASSAPPPPTSPTCASTTLPLPRARSSGSTARRAAPLPPLPRSRSGGACLRTRSACSRLRVTGQQPRTPRMTRRRRREEARQLRRQQRGRTGDRRRARLRLQRRPKKQPAATPRSSPPRGSPRPVSREPRLPSTGWAARTSRSPATSGYQRRSRRSSALRLAPRRSSLRSTGTRRCCGAGACAPVICAWQSGGVDPSIFPPAAASLFSPPRRCRSPLASIWWACASCD